MGLREFLSMGVSVDTGQFFACDAIVSLLCRCAAAEQASSALLQFATQAETVSRRAIVASKATVATEWRRPNAVVLLVLGGERGSAVCSHGSNNFGPEVGILCVHGGGGSRMKWNCMTASMSQSSPAAYRSQHLHAILLAERFQRLPVQPTNVVCREHRRLHGQRRGAERTVEFDFCLKKMTK